MKKLFGGFMALMIVGLAFMTGCQKNDVPVDAGLTEVAFVMTNPLKDSPSTSTSILKGDVVTDDGIPTCSNTDPLVVHLIGTGPFGAIDDTIPLLTSYDDGKQSVLIKLAPGDYTITQFDVLNAAAEVILASPKDGSTYQGLFNFVNNVPLDFTIAAFTKNKVDIDVLCWKDYAFQEFGYVWTDFHDFEIHTLCFFGDICTKFYDEWHNIDGSAYADVQVQGYDFPALFNVTVYNLDDTSHPTTATNVGATYVTADGDEIAGGPVCIEYLDNLEKPNEQYVAIIDLVLPDGSTVELEQITFSDTDYSDNGTGLEDVSDWGGDDAIWEFAVGDCAMAAQAEDIDGVYNIPWVPLPNEVTFKLLYSASNPFDAESYFALGNIQPDVEAGEFVANDTLAAWCGNKDWHITPGHTYNAHVYPYFNIPGTNTYATITMGQWNALNWIANEVDVTIAGKDAIQNAIWHILGYGVSANSVATSALANTDYMVPLGGYIIVLVDPYHDVSVQTDCSKEEIQLALVRFDP